MRRLRFDSSLFGALKFVYVRARAIRGLFHIRLWNIIRKTRIRRMMMYIPTDILCNKRDTVKGSVKNISGLFMNYHCGPLLVTTGFLLTMSRLRNTGSETFLVNYYHPTKLYGFMYIFSSVTIIINLHFVIFLYNQKVTISKKKLLC